MGEGRRREFRGAEQSAGGNPSPAGQTARPRRPSVARRYTLGMPQVRPFRAIGYALERFGSSRIPDRVRLPEEPPTHVHRVADLYLDTLTHGCYAP